jgi:hypothetical protein
MLSNCSMYQVLKESVWYDVLTTASGLWDVTPCSLVDCCCVRSDLEHFLLLGRDALTKVWKDQLHLDGNSTVLVYMTPCSLVNRYKGFWWTSASIHKGCVNITTLWDTMQLQLWGLKQKICRNVGTCLQKCAEPNSPLGGSRAVACGWTSRHGESNWRIFATRQKIVEGSENKK